MKVLSNVVDLAAHDDPSEHELALERIADFVDNIDVANDFYKIGGFAIFGACLNSPHSGIRWKAADIIAELTQNNPFCQERILEMGLMPILLGMVDTDDSEQARIKALYAVSCKSTTNAHMLQALIKFSSFSILSAKVLRTEHDANGWRKNFLIF